MSVARTIRFNVKSEFARNEIKRIIAVAVGPDAKSPRRNEIPQSQRNLSGTVYSVPPPTAFVASEPASQPRLLQTGRRTHRP